MENQPSNLTQLLKMAIEIVDLPILKIVIFHSYVGLPEGKSEITDIIGEHLGGMWWYF